MVLVETGDAHCVHSFVDAAGQARPFVSGEVQTAGLAQERQQLFELRVRADVVHC